MRYDDRLRTVLAQPADDPHDRAVRWRQLVELLARATDSSGDKALFDEAVAAVRNDAPAVDEKVRMAAARAISALPAPPELVCALAQDRLSIAAPVLAAARLTNSEWAQVSQRATPECRRFISTLRCEPASLEPPPSRQAEERGTDEQPSHATPSIGEVVARIERLRQSREQQLPADQSGAAAEAPAEQPRLFRWECDEAGEIDWVDGAPRGVLIGRSLAQGPDMAIADERLGRALALRMPFRDATFELAEGTPVAGRWKISGVPAFDPSSGRFAGYRGIAEREQPAQPGERERLPPSDPDALRELAHEIKTPLNAIIGFAEIISGQYLGPADAPYRQRAEEIMAQAQLLLAAIDDLDFAARTQSQGAAAVSDLHELAARIADELRGDGFDVEFEISGSPSCALEPLLGERLIGRFCRAVASAAEGEAVTFRIAGEDGHCAVSAARPQGASEETLGLGMRLVLGLARIAGGDLDLGGERLRLLLPQA